MKRKMKLLKKKAKQKNDKALQADKPKDPQCVVFSRGEVGKETKLLVENVRKVLSPNATNWMKYNRIKDIVEVSSPMNFTHMIIFSETEIGIYMKICRLPQGPTMTFQVKKFSFSNEVVSLLRKQHDTSSQFQVGPCLMTNLQPNEGELHNQLTAKMLLDMFPIITPHTANTDSIQRCCLIHHDPEKQLIDFRHYSIRLAPVGLSKPIKKLTSRKVPDLSKFNNMTEFMTKSGMLSESEMEDDPANEVTVNDIKPSVRQQASKRSAVRLSELGPRLSLKLRKIEAGLLEGEVLFNSVVKKTDEEKIKLAKQREKKKHLRLQRIKEQEKNVEAKRKQREAHKQKCLKGMKTKDSRNDQNEDEEQENDAEYFKEEIGEAPDAALFDKVEDTKKRKSDGEGWNKFKRFKKKKDGEDNNDDGEHDAKKKGHFKGRDGKPGKKGGLKGMDKKPGKKGGLKGVVKKGGNKAKGAGGGRPKGKNVSKGKGQKRKGKGKSKG